MRLLPPVRPVHAVFSADSPANIKTVAAKTLSDLPTEVLSQIFGTVVEDVREEILDYNYYIQEDYEILTSEAFKTVQILAAAQQIFGMNSRLRSIAQDRFSQVMESTPTDWTALANVLGYGEEFYTADFLMGGRELCHTLAGCNSTFSINSQLHEHALQLLLDNITFSIRFEVFTGWDGGSDFYLRVSETGVQLHAVNNYYDEVQYEALDLLPYLPKIKKAFVVTPPKNFMYNEEEDEAAHLTKDHTDCSLTLLTSVLPALESLTVCVNVPRQFSTDYIHAPDIVKNAVATLRTIPVKRKSIITSDAGLGYGSWHPDALPEIDIKGMTEGEIVGEILSPDLQSDHAFVISDE